MPQLTVLPGEMWLHRYERSDDLSWLVGTGWCSVTTTDHDLSVACELREAPGARDTSGPYRVLRVRDLSDHGALGIVAGVAQPLAESGISIFTVSSWDTCDTLVPARRLDQALDALMLAGFAVVDG
ncbi:MAG: ACT domain-containing protein [Acidimicrobiales bacterium]